MRVYISIHTRRAEVDAVASGSARDVTHITIRKLNANIISSYLTCTRRFQLHIFCPPAYVKMEPLGVVVVVGGVVVGVRVGIVGVVVAAYLH